VTAGGRREDHLPDHREGEGLAGLVARDGEPGTRVQQGMHRGWRAGVDHLLASCRATTEQPSVSGSRSAQSGLEIPVRLSQLADEGGPTPAAMAGRHHGPLRQRPPVVGEPDNRRGTRSRHRHLATFPGRGGVLTGAARAGQGQQTGSQPVGADSSAQPRRPVRRTWSPKAGGCPEDGRGALRPQRCDPCRRRPATRCGGSPGAAAAWEQLVAVGGGWRLRAHAGPVSVSRPQPPRPGSRPEALVGGPGRRPWRPARYSPKQSAVRPPRFPAAGSGRTTGSRRASAEASPPQGELGISQVPQRAARWALPRSRTAFGLGRTASSAKLHRAPGPRHRARGRCERPTPAASVRCCSAALRPSLTSRSKGGGGVEPPSSPATPRAVTPRPRPLTSDVGQMLPEPPDQAAQRRRGTGPA